MKSLHNTGTVFFLQNALFVLLCIASFVLFRLFCFVSFRFAFCFVSSVLFCFSLFCFVLLCFAFYFFIFALLLYTLHTVVVIVVKTHGVI